MKDFLKKELYSLRAVTAILARWLLLAVSTGLVCGAVGTAFHLAVERVTEWRGEHVWLLWLLPLAGLAIVALYKLNGCEGMGTNNVIRAVHSGESVSPLLVPAIFLGTVLTRFLPFLLFPAGKPTPKVITYLGKVLAPAVFGLLVVYCLKNVNLLTGSHGLPELLAIALVVGLHLWKRQILLSIAGGTVCYMLLVQFLFR